MKNNWFGTYPNCDHINNAIRFINQGKYETAINELKFAIEKADGYFHDDVKKILETKDKGKTND